MPALQAGSGVKEETMPKRDIEEFEGLLQAFEIVDRGQYIMTTSRRTFLVFPKGTSVYDLGDDITYIGDGSTAGGSAPVGGGGVEEAPIDGKQYARQDAGWSEVTAGGGVTIDESIPLRPDPALTTVTVDQNVRRLDMFPDNAVTDVVIPNSIFVDEAYAVVEVWNQAFDGLKVVNLRKEDTTLIKKIEANKGFMWFKRPETPAGDTIQTWGSDILPLDPAIYGNFFNPNWNDLTTATYTMAPTGAQILNGPTGVTFLPGSTYPCVIDLINGGGMFSLHVTFSTDSDFGNAVIGRDNGLTGVDLGSASSIGWKTPLY